VRGGRDDVAEIEGHVEAVVAAPEIPTNGARAESQAERAYQILRYAIANLQLQPDEPLSEAALAQRYGLGRTPIREAVQRLRHDGLVVSVPRRGLFVSSLRVADLREIYELLEALDGMVAYLATARAAPESLQQLVALNDAAVAALQREDHYAWQEHNFAFHQLLVELAGNRRIKQEFNLLHDQLKRALLHTLPLRSHQMQAMEEHRTLLQAMQQGDADLARGIAQQHRRRVRDEVLTAFPTSRY
jgi:DNA-binding GntR family transcriptional regulator